MFQLNSLKKLVKKRKVIGRGGNRGGTSTRGGKGQTARTGGRSKIRASFEGGQMPLTRRLPKRGFNNAVFAATIEIVNLGDLERVFNAGEEVNKISLQEKGLIRGQKGANVKLLGHGQLSKKLSIKVDAISKSAIEAIKKLGGSIELTKES